MRNRNEMQLIMEDWRRFLSEDEDGGKTPAELIADFEAAEERLKAVKDEAARKEILGKLFVGVSFLAFSIYIVPMIGSAAALAGISTGAGFLGRLLKVAATSGVAEAWNSLDDDVKESVLDKLPDMAGKAKGLAGDMVNKLLDMPDEESAQSALLKAIDLPDGLPDMLSQEAYETALARIKARLLDMAGSGQEMQGDSLSLARNTLKKAYGVYPREPQKVRS